MRYFGWNRFAACSPWRFVILFVVAVLVTSRGTNILSTAFSIPTRSSSRCSLVLQQKQRQQQGGGGKSVSVGRVLDATSSTSNELIEASGVKTTTAAAAEASTTVSSPSADKQHQPYPRLQAALVKAGMMAFIVGMCIALPLTLIPQWVAYKLGFLSRIQKEKNAVRTSQFCARWMLRIFPFVDLKAFPYHDPNPPESIWVCNHCSQLDVFMLLAADKRLRGPTRRPIKIVYWKQLEDNPVTALFFKQAGFIPVQMAANKAGEDNDYDKSSFRRLLKDSKQAFDEGFDIGILPEGQLNPNPEAGLLPVFAGAFSLARMSRRPVQMLAMHGAHRLWHPVDGLRVRGRRVLARVYPKAFRFQSGDDFVATFKAIVGEFATTGQDLPRDELDAWLSGDKVAKKTTTTTTTTTTMEKQPEQNKASSMK